MTTPIISDKMLHSGISTAVNKGFDYLVPYSAILPDSLKTSAADSITEMADTEAGHDWILKISNWIHEHIDWLISLFDSNNTILPTRNGMLAAIGVSPNGSETSVNPFAAIDKSLGIEVSSQIKDIGQDRIRQLCGWFGMSKKPADAIKQTLSAQQHIADVIETALLDKYGNDPDDAPKLKALAQQAAAVATGLDAKALASEDPQRWITRNPPTGGIGGLLYQTQKSPEHPVLALRIDNSSLNSVASALEYFKTNTAKRDHDRAIVEAKQAAPSSTVTGGADVPNHDGAPGQPAGTAKPKQPEGRT